MDESARRVHFAKLFYLLALALTVFGIAACSTEPAPVLTSATKNLAISSISQSPEVIDAAILQDGDKLSLVLVVKSTTTNARAKELGDNFVRQVKALSPDDSPSASIGTGVYNYIVGIVRPDTSYIAQGVKGKSMKNIDW